MRNLIILLIVSLICCGCGKIENTKHDAIKIIKLTQSQEENAKIETAKVTYEKLKTEITLPAQFKAQNKSLEKIYAPMEGKIEKIYFDIGDTIKKGDTIALLKTDEISQIQLEFLEKIMDIESDIKTQSAQCTLSNSEYERERTLYNEKISSRADYERALAEKQKDIAKLNSLKSKRSALINVYRSRLGVYGANIDTVLKTKKAQPYIELKASIGGVLLERKVNTGEFVEDNKEIFALADLSTIWLVGYAFEKDSAKLAVGQKVEAKSGNESIEGVLSYVSPILDNETKTLEVRADIENSDFKFKPNIYAEIIVNTGEKETLVVPDGAIEKYGDYNFAYVKTKEGTYEERKVEKGLKNEKYTEILSGLKEGETVVTNGIFSLLGESIKMSEK